MCFLKAAEDGLVRLLLSLTVQWAFFPSRALATKDCLLGYIIRAQGSFPPEIHRFRGHTEKIMLFAIFECCNPFAAMCIQSMYTS